jgi:hypothetical protein
VTRSYDDSQGEPVVQVGQFNAQSTLNWIKSLQSSSQIASKLSDLVVMGCSAGSIGAQIWGTTILEALSWSKAAIIPDSYAGVFPDGSQGPLVYGYGLCTWEHLPTILKESCNAQKLTIQQINEEFQRSNSHIPFGFIQSKADIVQQSFYVAIGFTTDTGAFITPEIFYQDVNQIFAAYNQNPNFVSYLVDGGQHCFTPADVYYTADGLGPKDDNSANNTGITMVNWLNQYPLDEGDNVGTLCLGELESVKKDAPDTKYCSDKVVPKNFTQPAY